MQFGDITGYIDLTQVILYLFWGFFVVLVFYLQYEGRREGFPLVADPSGKALNQDIWMPTPKTYVTNDGREITVPDPARADTRDLAAEFVVGGPGSPIVPTGNPIADGIGPASFAMRADVPDKDFDQRNRVVPMRIAADFEIPEADIDPRGCALIAGDGKQVGTITDVWVDRSDFVIRYLEAEIGGADAAVPGRVLVPWNIVDIKTDRDWFMNFIKADSPKPNATMHVYALTSDLYAGVPTTATPDAVTMLEEDKIMGYYGGGYLYATPERAEPLV
ncbi:MAG: photosynthetic reaction center subunit H [Pseudomonadota bacterium]